MNKNIVISDIINSVFTIERDAIDKLISTDYKQIESVVECIHSSVGRVIVTGMGKSAIIAQKMVATLNSTGTPSIFMHTADALHGDIGVLSDGDVVVLISKSGNTQEVCNLIRICKTMNLQTISICSNSESFLAKESKYNILIPIEKEADPNNLAPTASAVAYIAVCDAIAIALQELKEFKATDFALLHPKGNLGKRLHLTCAEIAQRRDKPAVRESDGLKTIIYEMSSKRLGACCVLGANDKVIGIITDGDIRRMLEKGTDLQNISAKEIMTNSPKVVDSLILATEALSLMSSHSITQLAVIDKEDNYIGIVHLHDLLAEGIV